MVLGAVRVQASRFVVVGSLFLLRTHTIVFGEFVLGGHCFVI